MSVTGPEIYARWKQLADDNNAPMGVYATIETVRHLDEYGATHAVIIAALFASYDDYRTLPKYMRNIDPDFKALEMKLTGYYPSAHVDEHGNQKGGDEELITDTVPLHLELDLQSLDLTHSQLKPLSVEEKFKAMFSEDVEQFKFQIETLVHASGPELIFGGKSILSSGCFAARKAKLEVEYCKMLSEETPGEETTKEQNPRPIK